MTPTKADEDAAREWLDGAGDFWKLSPKSRNECFEDTVSALAAFRAEARREVEAELGRLQETVACMEKAYLAEHESWGQCKWKLALRGEEGK
jgi:hypothetical protein